MGDATLDQENGLYSGLFSGTIKLNKFDMHLILIIMIEKNRILVDGI